MIKNIFRYWLVTVFLTSIANFSGATPDGIPDSLDRGHRLILKHGFQVQALTFPWSYPSGQWWSPTRWAESYFTTPNIHEAPGPQAFGPAPGIQWSRWMTWADCESGNPSLQKWYQALGQMRKCGLLGNDGTGNTPIPYACYYQSFIWNKSGWRDMGLTEYSISQYAPLAFGYKFTIAFVYNDPDGDGTELTAQIFEGNGDQITNKWFVHARQVKLL